MESPAKSVRPDMAFVLSHPAHWIAFGGGSGLSPYAPGTVGTLLAIPLYAVLALWLDSGAVLAVAGGFFLVGCWACSRTAIALGVVDHGGMNIDEIAAFLAVLAVAPDNWMWQAFAFGVFRFFDIVKPPPIRYFERIIPGGFGVMFDDLLAAGYTLLVLVIVYRVLA
jgi:phosphatidylglycerophosphatase A